MKLVLIAALSLLASCKDRPRESSQPAPSPGSNAPATAPGSSAAAGSSTPDICRSGLAMIDQATCAKPEARLSLVQTRNVIEHLVKTLGELAGADPRQSQMVCAQMLMALEQDAAKLGCTLAMDARQRKEITTLLDAWYGQRTPVTPTGDAAADAVIARI